MNPDEYYQFEDGRAYIKPTLSRDETLAFADTLRDVQNRNNAQVASQTSNLGTAVPSIQGGLSGSENYFKQRYQTIPSEVARKNLQATAQAKALNDLMTNAEAQYKNRYNQAYRSAQQRANSVTSNIDPTNIEPLTKKSYEDTIYTGAGAITISSDGEYAMGAPDPDGRYVFAYDANGNITATDNPNYAQADNGFYYNISDVDVPFSLEFRFPSEELRNRWKANQVASNQGGW